TDVADCTDGALVYLGRIGGRATCGGTTPRFVPGALAGILTARCLSIGAPSSRASRASRRVRGSLEGGAGSRARGLCEPRRSRSRVHRERVAASVVARDGQSRLPLARTRLAVGKNGAQAPRGVPGICG